MLRLSKNTTDDFLTTKAISLTVPDTPILISTLITPTLATRSSTSKRKNPLDVDNNNNNNNRNKKALISSESSIKLTDIITWSHLLIVQKTAWDSNNHSQLPLSICGESTHDQLSTSLKHTSSSIKYNDTTVDDDIDSNSDSKLPTTIKSQTKMNVSLFSELSKYVIVLQIDEPGTITQNFRNNAKQQLHTHTILSCLASRDVLRFLLTSDEFYMIAFDITTSDKIIQCPEFVNHSKSLMIRDDLQYLNTSSIIKAEHKSIHGDLYNVSIINRAVLNHQFTDTEQNSVYQLAYDTLIHDNKVDAHDQSNSGNNMNVKFDGYSELKFGYRDVVNESTQRRQRGGGFQYSLYTRHFRRELRHLQNVTDLIFVHFISKISGCGSMNHLLHYLGTRLALYK